MKCPKCSYTSFDYLDHCKRCGSDLRDSRTLLQIIAVSPEDKAPSTPRGGVAPEAVEQQPEQLIDHASAGPTEEAAQELFEELDFDGSFDDLVERTSYGDEVPSVDKKAAAQTAPAKQPPAAADDLLDLDFGDIFGDEDKDPT